LSKELVIVGKILKPVGFSGRFKLRSLTDNPRRFSLGEKLYIKTRFGVFPFKLSYIQKTDSSDIFIVAFEEVKEREKIELLCGNFVFAEVKFSEKDKSFDDEWYYYELLGLRVFSLKGKRYLGKVCDVLDTPEYSLLVVRGEGKEFYIPFVSRYIKSMSSQKKEIWLDYDFEEG